MPKFNHLFLITVLSVNDLSRVFSDAGDEAFAVKLTETKFGEGSSDLHPFRADGGSDDFPGGDVFHEGEKFFFETEIL